jgi:hypothetical protein
MPRPRPPCTDQRDQAIACLSELVNQTPDYRDAGRRLAQALDASAVLVPSGGFWMGSDAGDSGRRPKLGRNGKQIR